MAAISGEEASKTNTAQRGAASRAGYLAVAARKSRGPSVLVLLSLVPVALWAVAIPLDARFSNLSTSFTSLGVIAALAGTSAFALNLCLGARIKPVEAFFNGLDKMYRWHKRNGITAFALLSTHAILIIASRASTSLEEALRLFLPAAGWTVPLGVLALVLMGAGIVLSLYRRLSHETFVYVQRSFGFVFLLASLHVFRTPGTKAVSPALTLYLGALSALGLAAFAYRSLFGTVLVRRRSYSVTSVNHLDPYVLEIAMAPLDRPLQFTPGQFVFVTFEAAALSRNFHPFEITAEGEFAVVTFRPGRMSNQYHPFSITSAPGEEELKIVVKVLGDYTGALRDLPRHAAARVEGPYGRFSYLRIPNRRQIWIAGGIGVTPFLSMARSLRDSEYEIDFYYAMEHGHQGFFLDEFFAIADRNPKMRVIPIRKDRLGYVTAADIEGVSKPLADNDILICGPPPMIHNLERQFLEMGVPRRQIHFELFGFAGKTGT